MEGVGTPALLAPDRLDRPFGDPLIGRLFPALSAGGEWDLARVRSALGALGDPHRRFESFHVGGTNGKGSVTTTVASILVEEGRKAGCYTSPHLVSFRERIRVEGRALAVETLEAYASEVRGPVADARLTFFEAATVLAFHAFAGEGVEVAAVEVGLGGRLDATNVLRPLVAAVTNVAMDHADYLGDTLVLIAGEKAGIAKRSVPFLTSELEPDLVRVLADGARMAGTVLTALATEDVADVSVGRGGTSLHLARSLWGPLDLTTPLVGTHQATNAALAVRMLEAAPESWRPSRGAVERGVAGVRYHGRGELRSHGGLTWLFDVAHNEAGAASLRDTLRALDLPGPLVTVIGGLRDKDWPRMLPLLLSGATAAVLTRPPSAPEERVWNPADAVTPISGAGPPVRVLEAFDEALRVAAAEAGSGTVLVTGSAHTVGDAMALVGVDPLG